MSLKMKWTSTICAFFLILGLVIMGVFASPQASVNLGGTITFHATDVYANVYGSITGAVESETAGGTLSLTTLNFEAGETTDASSWANVPLTFNDMGEVITISITIENLATDRPLYASVKDNYGAVTNVTKGMKKGEATYTGDCLTIPQKSGDDTNKVTINLTMEVKDKNFSLADELRYGYLVNLSNEEIEVPTVRTNSESLGTVTSSVNDGVLTVEVQPQEGAQFVGFRKTASGSLQASAVSSEQEFEIFNIATIGALRLPYFAVSRYQQLANANGLTEELALQLIQEASQKSFMDYSIYLGSTALVNVAKTFYSMMDSLPQETIDEMKGLPGVIETINLLANEKWSYSFDYVEGDKYQAVFSTCEMVENENGYTYEKFPDAGISIIKKFDLPDGQSTDITLASTLGGYRVFGMSIDSAKLLNFVINGVGTSASVFTDECTSITFPDSYIYYPDFLCSSLTSLKIVKIGRGATSIPASALRYCSSLEKVIIPDGVKKVGDYAFDACSGLRSITIPSSVTSIGGFAFDGCSGLTSVTVNNEEVASLLTGTGNSVAGDLLGNSNLATIYFKKDIWTNNNGYVLPEYVTTNYTNVTEETIDGVTYKKYTKSA